MVGKPLIKDFNQAIGALILDDIKDWQEKTVIFSFSLLVVSQMLLIICYTQIYPWLMIISTILLSWGRATCFSLFNLIDADLGDEDEMPTKPST